MTTILLADDDKAVRLVLGKIMSAWGLHVLMAADGLRARTLLEDNPDIQVLLTDVVMPILDGRDLVAGLRRDKRFHNLGIIVMSAEVTISEITHLLELGASRFLAKPVSERTLRRELEPLLDALP